MTISIEVAKALLEHSKKMSPEAWQKFKVSFHAALGRGHTPEFALIQAEIKNSTGQGSFSPLHDV